MFRCLRRKFNGDASEVAFALLLSYEQFLFFVSRFCQTGSFLQLNIVMLTLSSSLIGGRYSKIDHGWNLSDADRNVALVVLFGIFSTSTAASTSASSGFVANDGSIAFAINLPRTDNSSDIYFSM